MRKDILHMTTIGIIFAILLNGCLMKSSDYDEETTKKAEETAISYVENNYQDIDTVEIEKVYRNPLGGMSVDGIVNGQYEFSLSVEEEDFTVKSGAYGEGFPDRKEECKNKSCDY